MQVIEIHDQRFLTEFYRDFCRRGVYGKFNQDALARKRIDVWWMPAYGQQLEINIFDCGLGESTIDLGWDQVKGAWPVYHRNVDKALATCDRTALTTFVRRFLLKHGVIDNTGVFVKRGVA